jgi:hypothetical protein
MTDLTSIPFKPDLSAECFCKSGNKFIDCCGSTAQDRPPPLGIKIIPNALPNNECQALIDHIQIQPKQWLEASKRNPLTGETQPSRDPNRVTQIVRMGQYRDRIRQLANDNFTDIIEGSYQQKIAWIENPAIMYYMEGGLFNEHADSEVYDDSIKRWRKVIDRDYSMLFYLNGDFEGGNISFGNFNYSYHPQMGDLIIFPSDHRYIHTAQPVTKGKRFAIVSWAIIKDSPKVDKTPPNNAIFIRD